MISSTDEVVSRQLGLSDADALGLLRELIQGGYVNARYENQRWPTSPPIYTVWHLTDAGLREIGQLPDPHAELMQRLDLAILQIQQDTRLSEPQKQQTINWLEEGKIVARTLTIEAIIAGAIL
jgi:hypothetical protein